MPLGFGDVRNTTQPRIVERISAVLPANTQTPYFTVIGKVIITFLVATVETQIQAQATNIKWVSNPLIGADTDFCVAQDINADTVGTIYSLTGTLSDNLVITTSGAFEGQSKGIVVDEGTIDLDCDANSSGQLSVVLHYIPLTSNSGVVTA